MIIKISTLYLNCYFTKKKSEHWLIGRFQWITSKCIENYFKIEDNTQYNGAIIVKLAEDQHKFSFRQPRKDKLLFNQQTVPSHSTDLNF